MSKAGNKKDVTGVILAGGLGSRMGYQDKAAMQVRGLSVLERLMAVFRPVFPEILISVGKKEDADKSWPAPEPARLVQDVFSGRSSLAGIHAGLTAASNPHIFVAACDAPFVRPEMIKLLLDRLRPEDDVVMPMKENGWGEPLCAIYSTRCLPHIEAQLEREDCKIIRFFPEVRVREIGAELLRKVDPEYASFINVNTPEELRAANESEEVAG